MSDLNRMLIFINSFWKNFLTKRIILVLMKNNKIK
jgi:hypothetical protein